jgi:Nif-specific regulatory protein
MKPRLIAIAGPVEGKTITLSQEEFLIGRDPSSHLLISDPLISRRHSIIRHQAGSYYITDLDSANGTFVNGIPMKERALAHGDLIAAGDSIFAFLTHEDEPAETHNSIRLTEASPDAQSTIILREEELLYLHPEKAIGMLPPTLRLARDLSTLLKISMEINSIRGLEELEQRLLESIFEVVPAERGAIILKRPDSNDVASVWERNRLESFDRPVQLSRTIVHRVFDEGISILSNDVLESEAYSTVESLVIPEIHSLLAVPLRIFDRVMGLIYLSNRDLEVQFNEEHLQLVTAIANMAAGALENARYSEWLESENRRLQEDVNIEHEMVGGSPRMKDVYQFIYKVTRTDSTVLIRGESGTGKELVARAIHLNSLRADRPFVAINCATLTETLLESELFGHEKGAFTGAVVQKRGKLEVADGGTVFLDEMGELAPMLQAKLLRVLQEQEFERVGGTRPIKINIRLIAATNRDLEQAIRDGSFRQDLYYRLNVVKLTMPPLRERREDIPLLANYFVKKYSQKCKRPVKGISQEARALLMSHSWPGNVRELENAIERAVVMGSTEILLPEDLPEALIDEAEAPAGSTAIKYYEAVQEAKKRIILDAMEQAGGNHNEAAKMLGVHPNNLHRLVRSLNLKVGLKK